jgi:ectoine hydroxylase-related dioxygenase (phytanoyl-CoA dioxygenase family)
MWDARMEPGVLNAFSKLWGTDELLVSFDCLNVTLPNRPDLPARAPWQHIDQSPNKRGLHCVQGIINLCSSGPDDGGLVVYPGSHLLNDEFFDAHPNSALKQLRNDIYLFPKDELEWFEQRGLQPHKVCAELGDLILWDSRTIHYGADATEAGKHIRTAIYATYMPACLAKEEQLEKKRKVFDEFGSTSHWPYEHIEPGAQKAKPLLPDGSIDPRAERRKEPLEKPVHSAKLLKLAGVLPY